MILRAVEGRKAVVERAWEGRTAVCMATGPSFSPELAEVVRASGAATIAVNDAYLLAPWADLLYFADRKWWEWQRKPDRLERWEAFAGQKATIAVGGSEAPEKGVLVLGNASHGGPANVALSTDPGMIVTASNSGYQGLNIATLSGANPILLIGYDCRDVDGRTHFFGDHPDRSKPPYDSIRGRFEQANHAARAMGVRIVNCTPGSALECFEAGELENLLAVPA